MEMAENEKTRKGGRRLRVLTLGPLPPPYTGTPVSYQHLVDFLGNHPDVQLSMLNTMGIRGNGLKGVVRFGRLLWRSLTFSRKCDVVTLHCSTTALHIMGISVYLVAWLTGKPLIIRKFAGDDYPATLGKLGQAIAEFVLRRTELYLVQTQQLLKQSQDRGLPNVKWYPTSRPVPEIEQGAFKAGAQCLRFVYVGRVCEAKGMRLLANIDDRLPDGVTIDIYGPWYDDLERNIFDDCSNITYRGMLEPQEVIEAMRKYDASVLPTHYEREGYPGAVMESYIAGLPVIATRWRALPEIIDESVGILVEPKSADAFLQAMFRLAQDKALFQKLRSNTWSKANFFSTQHWGERFIELCREVAGKKSRDKQS